MQNMKFRRRNLPGFEIAYLDCTGRSFAKHAHEEFVISANVVGREHIWLDGASHEAQASEVTLYNPGQVQAGDARNHPWAFFSLYVEPGWFHSQLDIAKEILFQKPIFPYNHQAESIKQLGQAALIGGMGNDEVIECTLLVLEQLVADCGIATQPVSPETCRKKVVRIRDLLLDQMNDPLPVSSLAALVDMTPVQLVRAFKLAYGLPPHQWLNIQRLIRARRSLQNGFANLAALALDLGFADQAHFTRRFAAVYGVTPAAYARG